MAAKTKQPPRGQELDAEDYFAAAQDLAGALPSLYSNGDYPLTIYTSGLAVECLFRAFRAKRGLAFRSDHRLGDLAEEAGFPHLLPGTDRELYDAALNTLIVGWRNAHRYRSKGAMRRFLKGLKLDRRIRGDYLKENARRMSSSAVDLIGLGVQQWQL